MDLRSIILGADDLPKECVPVPEWPVPADSLYAKTFSPEEFWALQESWRKGVPENEDAPNSRVHLTTVIAGTVDASGKAVFTDADYDTLAQKKSIVAIARLFNVIARLNGMMKADAEELKKNSDATAGSPGSAGSPTVAESASRNCSANTV